MEVFYRIRNTKTNLYSNGGEEGVFRKRGRYWKSIGNIKNHLGNLTAEKIKKYYMDCVLEEVIMETTNSIDMLAFSLAYREGKDKMDKAWETRWQIEDNKRKIRKAKETLMGLGITSLT